MKNGLVNCIYEFGPFGLDEGEFRLLREGKVVQLKPKVFHLLLVLVRNSGHILTKGELMEEIWPDSFVEEHNLAVSIFSLRRALEETPDCPYIETVPRRGYRFVARVRRREIEAENFGPEKSTRSDGVSKDFRVPVVMPSLAVLPFKLIGRAAATEYLGQGIADALITRLSNLSRIIVRPTGAVRSYTDVNDPIVAGRELKVTTILDGNIQEIGSKLRVTVQLINIENGSTLWGQKFDEDHSDILKMEDSISEQVADALIKLTEIERERFAKRYTRNAQAYQAYMKGRFFWEKRSINSLQRSDRYFQQALELDPDYALAYVGLARSFLSQTDLLLSPPEESVKKARHMIQKALEIDAGLAEAHALLGYISLVYDRDRPEAERKFRLALEINPNGSETHQFYSYYLKLTGRFDEAIAEIRRAQEIDPTSSKIGAKVGLTLYLARRYDEAAPEIENALELDPNCVDALFCSGLIHEQKNNFEKALEAYQRAQSLSGKAGAEILGNLGRAYALAGQLVKARELLAHLLALSKEKYVSPYHIAYVYLGLGDKNKVFECLEKSFQNRDLELALLRVDPALDPLRLDGRFKSLLTRALP